MIIHIPFHFQLIQSYPLPVAHQKLCQMIYQLALHNDERACIAGSHALQQVMKEMGRATFRSNDVDVFTTLYFTAEDMKILERKFEEQCRDYFFCVDKIMESRSRVDGMRQIWNLVVMQIQRIGNIAEVQTMDPPIQIVVLNNELPHDLRSNDHGFAVEVVDRFDISVCKCVIPNLFKLNRVLAISRSDILNWEMEYDLRKLKSTDNAWKRLLKYSTRGFKLSRLRFDNSQVIHMVDGIVRIFERGNQLLENDTIATPSYEPMDNIESVSILSTDENGDLEIAF
jgi:hypothetical protein